MKKTIRIGTRSGELALWQANTVAEQLEHLEYDTEIIKFDTFGDETVNSADFKIDRPDFFTKDLDAALLDKKIDIAVHALKDVPTVLPEGIVQAAVLKRGNFNDVLVLKNNEDFFANKTAIIAAGSSRCKAQWLHRFPNHTVVDLYGSINSRLQQLKESNWDGAVFSMAGLKRINFKLITENHLKLDWMVPAPAQGAVMIAALEKNNEIVNTCKELNDHETEICTTIEREFLLALESDSSAPIGALAVIREEELKFRGAIFSPDGKNKLEFSKTVPANHTTDIAQFAAKFILDRGGKKIMRQELHIEKETLIFSTKNLSLTQTSTLPAHVGIAMSDFITIQYNRLKPIVVKNKIDNVVLTSQSAVESLLNSFDKSELNFTNIYCVGRRTKRLIERNIGKVAHVENSAEKLAQYVVDNVKNREVTFFCGNESKNELSDILSKNNYEVHEIECYKTIHTPNKVDKKYQGILFFSPAEIESYLKGNTPDNEVVFCNGTSTAKEAKKHFKNVKTAKMPTAESVLKAVNEYYDKK